MVLTWGTVAVTSKNINIIEVNGDDLIALSRNLDASPYYYMAGDINSYRVTSANGMALKAIRSRCFYNEKVRLMREIFSIFIRNVAIRNARYR